VYWRAHAHVDVERGPCDFGLWDIYFDAERDVRALAFKRFRDELPVTDEDFIMAIFFIYSAISLPWLLDSRFGRFRYYSFDFFDILYLSGTSIINTGEMLIWFQPAILSVLLLRFHADADCSAHASAGRRSLTVIKCRLLFRLSDVFAWLFRFWSHSRRHASALFWWLMPLGAFIDTMPAADFMPLLYRTSLPYFTLHYFR